MTDTLSDFLMARIAEDESAARPFRNDFGDVRPWRCDEIGGTVRNGPNPLGDRDDVVAKAVLHLTGVHIARHDPARVLADCAAKRHTIQACTYWLGEDNADARSLAVAVLTSLASAHTAHPGFNPVWLETV